MGRHDPASDGHWVIVSDDRLENRSEFQRFGIFAIEKSNGRRTHRDAIAGGGHPALKPRLPKNLDVPQKLPGCPADPTDFLSREPLHQIARLDSCQPRVLTGAGTGFWFDSSERGFVLKHRITSWFS